MTLVDQYNGMFFQIKIYMYLAGEDEDDYII